MRKTNMVRVAEVITTAEVGRLLGWESRRARRWLLNTGAGVKRAGRVITTPELLSAYFPELGAVLRARAEGRPAATLAAA